MISKYRIPKASLTLFLIAYCQLSLSSTATNYFATKSEITIADLMNTQGVGVDGTTLYVSGESSAT